MQCVPGTLTLGHEADSSHPSSQGKEHVELCFHSSMSSWYGA